MPYIGYAFISLICLGVVLVSYSRISQRVHPLLLYGASAGMVLTTTLAGPYLVGSDIHLEYYYAQLRHGRDVLLPIIGTPQGTSILAYVSGSIWAYKIVYPLLFCLVPVILYYVYQRWLTPKQAFLASFLLIAFPAFSLELPAIARQAVAELVLVIAVYLILKSSLRNRYKLPTLGICGVLLPLIHYSIGIIALIIFSLGLLIDRVLKQEMWKPLLVLLVCTVIASCSYFPMAEGGAVVKKLGNLYDSFVPETLRVEVPKLEIPTSPRRQPPPTHIEKETKPGIPLQKRYSQLMQIAFGLDFMKVDALGKMFRVLQWLVILGVLIGLWKLRTRKSYWVLGGGFILISALCLVPGWASIMNASRFAHISLLLVAPAFALSMKSKYLPAILILYFLFTSGFVFEATQQPNVEEPIIPYNIGLSDHRIDLGATYNEGDVKVRKYIVENGLFPVSSDFFGADFIGEKVGLRGDINWPLPNRGDYLYVRSRNMRDKAFTIWNGVGCRRQVTPEDLGIDWNKNIVYQSGDAKVLELE
jgi:hypothetical protein